MMKTIQYVQYILFKSLALSKMKLILTEYVDLLVRKRQTTQIYVCLRYLMRDFVFITKLMHITTKIKRELFSFQQESLQVMSESCL